MPHIMRLDQEGLRQALDHGIRFGVAARQDLGAPSIVQLSPKSRLPRSGNAKPCNIHIESVAKFDTELPLGELG